MCVYDWFKFASKETLEFICAHSGWNAFLRGSLTLNFFSLLSLWFPYNNKVIIFRNRKKNRVNSNDCCTTVVIPQPQKSVHMDGLLWCSLRTQYINMIERNRIHVMCIFLVFSMYGARQSVHWLISCCFVKNPYRRCPSITP